MQDVTAYLRCPFMMRWWDDTTNVPLYMWVRNTYTYYNGDVHMDAMYINGAGRDKVVSLKFQTDDHTDGWSLVYPDDVKYQLKAHNLLVRLGMI